MKKRLIRNSIIMAIATFIMAVVLGLYISSTSPLPAADAADTYADGTYTSGAQGCLSEVSVSVTIIGGKVSKVAIDAAGETPELGGHAAEVLAAQLTEAGTTAGIDAVAGATMTSEAVFTAMSDCLAQAAQ